MNELQQIFVNTILAAAQNPKQDDANIYSLEAYGGTGKTFCLATILSELRGKEKIAIVMAISAQAATLLEGGTTVHSKMKVAIDLDGIEKEFSPNSAIAKVITEASLLIIDEYTLGDKRLYEIIDRKFRKLMKNNIPFGGKVMLFSGDWTQCLPIVPNGDRADIVGQTMKASYLWDYVQQLRLEENMRIKNANADDKEFNQYLLDLGQGKLQTYPEIEEYMIKIPEQMKSKAKNRKEFCEEIFPNLGERIEAGFRDRDINENWSKWVHKRAIICARNDDCQEINRICVDMMKGKPHVYRSADKVVNANSKSQAVPVEFLNSQTPSGCPDHCIVLKEGAPIILLRNMNKKKGHVNGARYADIFFLFKI